MTNDLHWQLRQNSQEYQDYLVELHAWEQKVKSKDANVKKDAECEKVDHQVLPAKQQSVDGSSCLISVENEHVSEEQRKKAQEEKELGNMCFKRKDFDGALKHYTDSIRLDPTSHVYYLNRSMAHLKLKQYAKAEQDCSKALSLDTKNVKALWRRGTARRFMGKLKHALEDLGQAHVLSPDDAMLKKEMKDLETVLQVQSKTVKKVKKAERRRIFIEEIGGDEDGDEKTVEVKPVLANEPQVEKAFDEMEIKEAQTRRIAKPETKRSAIQIEELESEAMDDERDKEATEKEPSDDKHAAAKLSPSSLKTETAKQSPVTAASKSTSTYAIPTNSVEFERDWKVVRGSPRSAVEYLRALEPKNYVSLFKNNLQAEHITAFVQLVQEIEDTIRRTSMLASFSKLPRLSMNMMFVSKSDLLKNMLDGMEQSIRKAYGL